MIEPGDLVSTMYGNTKMIIRVVAHESLGACLEAHAASYDGCIFIADAGPSRPPTDVNPP